MKEKNIQVLWNIIISVFGLFIIVFPNFFPNLAKVIKIMLFVVGTTFIIGYYLRDRLFLNSDNSISVLNLFFTSILLVLFILAMLTPSDVNIPILNRLIPTPAPIIIVEKDTITIEEEKTSPPITTPEPEISIPLYDLVSVDNYNVDIQESTTLKTNDGEDIDSYFCSLEKKEHDGYIVYNLKEQYNRFTGLFTITNYNKASDSFENSVKIFLDDNPVPISKIENFCTNDISFPIDFELNDCKTLTIWISTDTRNAVLANPTLYKTID